MDPLSHAPRASWSHVPEWTDNQTMAVLFAPFRENRNVNPTSWDRKIDFWSSLIAQEYRLNNSAHFTARDLPSKFERNGKVPFCLGVVVQDMIAKNKIQTLESFMSSSANPTWTTWTYGMFVKAPVKFAFNWLVKKPVSWTLQQVLPKKDETMTSPMRPSSMDQLDSTEYVLPDVIKFVAEKLLEFHFQSIENAVTDNVKNLDEFGIQTHHLYNDDKTFQLSIVFLCNQKKCAVQTVDGVKVIRFAQQHKSVSENQTDTDLSIYRLKAAKETLREQIDNISSDKEKCRLEAKHHLSKGSKTSAKHCLLRKKRLEVQQEKKEAAIDNIDQLLFNIEQAYIDKQVLNVYSLGVETMKDINKDITPEKVDDIMDSVHEAFGYQEELSRSMLLDNNVNDISDSDLLAELEEESVSARRDPVSKSPDILAAGIGDLKLDDLPDVPLHEPASSSFLTNSTPSPAQRTPVFAHAEPVWSHTAENLPDVPYHNPAGSPIGPPSPPSPFKDWTASTPVNSRHSPHQAHMFPDQHHTTPDRFGNKKAGRSFEQYFEPPAGF